MNRVDTFRMFVFLKADETSAVPLRDANRVQQLIDQHDFAVAVWNDPMQEDGKDLLIIKGRPEFVMGHFVTSGNWTAFPCESATQAELVQECARSGKAVRLE